MTEFPEQDYDNCGTYAGYNQHKRDRTRVCPACRTAATKYQRERRKKDPEAYAEEVFMNKARSRALWALARIHPHEFQALVAEEVIRGHRGDRPT